MSDQRTGRMAVVTRPEVVEFRSVKIPSMKDDQVLIKVKASAICGSDLHIYRGRHPSAPLPCTFGHELCGEVVEVGEKVHMVKVGDRVCVEPLITCGHCYYCLRGQYNYCVNLKLKYRSGEGAFSDYYIASERWVHILKENISYEEGCLMEPLAVAVHAGRKALISPGDSAAIFGDGAIGLMLLQIVRSWGVYPAILVGIIDKNLELAATLGASRTINARKLDPVKEILASTEGLGVDASFEAVGLNTTFNQCVSSLKNGGRAVIAGVFEEPLVPEDLRFELAKEKQIIGTSSYRWDFESAIDLVHKGIVHLKPLITHTFPLSELKTALEKKSNAQSGAIKIVMYP